MCLNEMAQRTATLIRRHRGCRQEPNPCAPCRAVRHSGLPRRDAAARLFHRRDPPPAFRYLWRRPVLLGWSARSGRPRTPTCKSWLPKALRDGLETATAVRASAARHPAKNSGRPRLWRSMSGASTLPNVAGLPRDVEGLVRRWFVSEIGDTTAATIGIEGIDGTGEVPAQAM